MLLLLIDQKTILMMNEEFVELGDYFVIGKDGLVYIKHGLNFESMFREKENV